MSQHPLMRTLRQLVGRVARTTTGEATTARRPTARPRLLALEDRTLPANASGILSGVAFVDLNNNGVRESRETLLPGAWMTLVGRTTTGQNVRTSVATNGQGAYRFLNVLPGQYQIYANPVPGFSPSLSNGKSLGAVGGAKLVMNRALVGGQQIWTRVSYRGLSPSFVSMNQFLSSSRNAAFPFAKPGAGNSAVNFRANNKPIVKTAIPNVTANQNAANQIIDLAAYFSDPDVTNTLVQIVTSAGNIDVELFDKDAPQTVANFLNYVRSNHYDSTVFHRLASNFVLQGGGFKFNTNPSRLDDLPVDPAVKNEFDGTKRSNLEGTLAMAKLPGDADSATDQFFFNLANNSSNLDNQNGGFTVFGKLVDNRRFVPGSDRYVLDRLASLPVRDFSSFNSAFDTFPISNYTGSTFPTDTTAANYAMIKDVKIVKQNERLTYSLVSNSNPGLLTATIKDNRLTLDYTTGQSGTATIQVRATDRFGSTVVSSFTVTVSNQEPTISDVALAADPSGPVNIGTPVKATVTATDPNSDPLTYTYTWRVQNGAQTETRFEETRTGIASATNVLDLPALVAQGKAFRGDVVVVEVIASDGDKSSTMVSETITVADALATVDTLTITPTSPFYDETNVVVNFTGSDLDGEAVTYDVVFKLNGSTVDSVLDTTDTSFTRSLVTFNAGPTDEFSVVVTPRSNGVNGTARTETITVANRLPTATVDLTGPIYVNSTVTANTTTNDEDSDPVTLTYVWKIDGVSVPGNNSPVLNLGGQVLQKGQLVSVEVTPNDGHANGTAVLSNVLTIQDSLPTITALSLVQNGNLVEMSVSATDADLDPVDFIIVWTIDGVAQTPIEQSSSTASLNLTDLGIAPGTEISVSVTPRADGAIGTPDSETITVVI